MNSVRKIKIGFKIYIDIDKMSLIYLDETNFYIQDTPNEKKLCCDLQGISMVVYYLKSCPICMEFLPKYKELAGIYTGCKFAILDMKKTKHKKVSKASKKTSIPITYVPFIVLYINNVPVESPYVGPREIEHIIRYISEKLQEVRQQFTVQSKKDQKKGKTQKYPHGRPYNIGGIYSNAKDCYGQGQYIQGETDHDRYQ